MKYLIYDVKVKNMDITFAWIPKLGLNKQYVDAETADYRHFLTRVKAKFWFIEVKNGRH